MCLVSLLALLVACAPREYLSCRAVLYAMMKAEIALPAGQIYDLSAPEGDSEYFDERIINSLWGEGSPPPMRQGWIDLALFLPSSGHPCELAVFLCDSPDTATDTARLLCRRLDVIRSNKKNAEYSVMLDSASVTIVGNYVILAVSSDTEKAIKIAREVIK